MVHFSYFVLALAIFMTAFTVVKSIIDKGLDIGLFVVTAFMYFIALVNITYHKKRKQRYKNELETGVVEPKPELKKTLYWCISSGIVLAVSVALIIIGDFYSDILFNISSIVVPISMFSFGVSLFLFIYRRR